MREYVFYIKSMLIYYIILLPKFILRAPRVLNINLTIQKIIKEKASFARFGDGELEVMIGKGNGFQQENINLSNRLIEVSRSNLDGLFIGIPDYFGGIGRFNRNSRIFVANHLYENASKWMIFFSKEIVYLDSLSTRFYMNLRDKRPVEKYVHQWKSVWNKRNIVIIEGEFSRLGYGNDLFDNANSIERILCPSENAFDFYEEIFAQAKKIDNTCLILIALGQTATILAYDLHKLGYQAIDIGHIDVEYEWYKMGVLKKTPLKNKYVNEVGSRINAPLDSKEYNQQIIAIVK